MNDATLFCNDRGIKILDAKFSKLESILNQWTKLFSESIEVFEQTSESYFLESSLTSMLNTAVWQSNKIGLVEVKTPKLQKGPQTTIWNGRCDLLIAKANKIEFAIEAKLAWLWDSWNAEQVKGGIHAALADASNLPNNIIEFDVNQKVGVLYCLFWLKKKESRQQLVKKMKDVVKNETPSFLAWDLYPHCEAENHNCAGAVLIGKALH